MRSPRAALKLFCHPSGSPRTSPADLAFPLSLAMRHAWSCGRSIQRCAISGARTVSDIASRIQRRLPDRSFRQSFVPKAVSTFANVSCRRHAGVAGCFQPLGALGDACDQHRLLLPNSE